MLSVGLTGGIASGKSVVRRRFESHGIPTLDADRIVHALLGAGMEASEEIRESFGEDVLAPDGAVDRKALGELIFRDRGARGRLEAIVHPRVGRSIEEFLEKARAEGAELAVVDAALMIETGSYRRYDRVVVAYCPSAVQKARLMDREGFGEDEADLRIAAQMSVDDKRKVADYVIDTSGTMEETLRNTDAVLERLRAEAS